jgi:hypothetical protein
MPIQLPLFPDAALLDIGLGHGSRPSVSMSILGCPRAAALAAAL